MTTATVDDLMAMYQQLDLARRRELEELALQLVAEQRAEEWVREHGALTMEQLKGMTLGDV